MNIKFWMGRWFSCPVKLHGTGIWVKIKVQQMATLQPNNNNNNKKHLFSALIQAKTCSMELYKN